MNTKQVLGFAFLCFDPWEKNEVLDLYQTKYLQVLGSGFSTLPVISNLQSCNEVQGQ